MNTDCKSFLIFAVFSANSQAMSHGQSVPAMSEDHFSKSDTSSCNSSKISCSNFFVLTQASYLHKPFDQAVLDCPKLFFQVSKDFRFNFYRHSRRCLFDSNFNSNTDCPNRQTSTNGNFIISRSRQLKGIDKISQIENGCNFNQYMQRWISYVQYLNGGSTNASSNCNPGSVLGYDLLSY